MTEQQKRRMTVGRKVQYRTNDPRVTLERIREQQGYLLLDFSHTKYLGKETLRVKIDEWTDVFMSVIYSKGN